MPSSAPAVVLVSSFDGFSACWPPFCHGLTKYWPDRPYRAFLVSNYTDSPCPQIQAIKVGPDGGWSSNLLAALAHVSSPFVLYLQEDYWLEEPVNTAALEQYLRLMEAERLDYLRLLAFPKPDRDYPGDERLGILAPDAAYRTSLQAAFWRTEFLRSLLVPGETAWSFEVNGTERSRGRGDTMLSVKAKGTDEYFHGIRYLCSAINRGRWARAARAYARAEGVPVDFSTLPRETWWHEFHRKGRWAALAVVILHRARMIFGQPRTALRKARARWGRNL
jgi:hypothetical protein